MISTRTNGMGRGLLRANVCLSSVMRTCAATTPITTNNVAKMIRGKGNWRTLQNRDSGRTWVEGLFSMCLASFCSYCIHDFSSFCPEALLQGGNREARPAAFFPDLHRNDNDQDVWQVRREEGQGVVICQSPSRRWPGRAQRESFESPACLYLFLD